MIGLGLIVPGKIKDGEVVVVRNWDELEVKGKADELRGKFIIEYMLGKIVCYNVPWTKYSDLKSYR